MNTEFVKEPIPVWALCALINADYTGLEDEDIELVNRWMDETGYTIVCCPSEEDEMYFEPFPPFGLATDVIECWCCK